MLSERPECRHFVVIVNSKANILYTPLGTNSANYILGTRNNIYYTLLTYLLEIKPFGPRFHPYDLILPIQMINLCTFCCDAEHDNSWWLIQAKDVALVLVQFWVALSYLNSLSLPEAIFNDQDFSTLGGRRTGVVLFYVFSYSQWVCFLGV